jgi:hypothetical protein
MHNWLICLNVAIKINFTTRDEAGFKPTNGNVNEG